MSRPDRVAARNLALAGALALVALYLLAVGTSVGRTIDEKGLLAHDEASALPQVAQATDALLLTIDRGSLVLIGGAALAVALLRGRTRRAIVVATLLVGANVSTQILKPVLAFLDPTGGDALRSELPGAFPSGHATVAMSLALAVVIAAPVAWRAIAGVAGAAYAAAIGVGLVVLGWHYPSDVTGGFLVAGTWACIGWWLVGPSYEGAEPSDERASRRIALVVSVAGTAVVLGMGAYLLVQRPEIVAFGAARTTFFVGAAINAALALATVAFAEWLLSRVDAVPARIARTLTRPVRRRRQRA